MVYGVPLAVTFHSRKVVPMFDDLVWQLGRFDSIVTAHKSGDYLELQKAVQANMQTQHALIREAAETQRRAERLFHLLWKLDSAIDAEINDITVVTFHQGTEE
jgi:hypothetical protein